MTASASMGLTGADVEHAGGYAFLSQRFGGLQKQLATQTPEAIRVTSEPSRRRIGLAEIQTRSHRQRRFRPETGAGAQSRMYTGPSMLDDGGQGLGGAAPSPWARTPGMPGRVRMMPMSSSAMCVPPLSSAPTPGSAADDFDVQPGVACRDGDLGRSSGGKRTWRRLHAKGILPQADSPAATPTILASAMPTLKERSDRPP